MSVAILNIQNYRLLNFSNNLLNLFFQSTTGQDEVDGWECRLNLPIDKLNDVSIDVFARE